MASASTLHDIGKIFEYTIDLESGLIDYDEDFRKEWITHSQYGFTICMTAGFKRIAKMIAAHHARTDWGAIVDLSLTIKQAYIEEIPATNNNTDFERYLAPSSPNLATKNVSAKTASKTKGKRIITGKNNACQPILRVSLRLGSSSLLIGFTL